MLPIKVQLCYVESVCVVAVCAIFGDAVMKFFTAALGRIITKKEVLRIDASTLKQNMEKENTMSRLWSLTSNVKLIKALPPPVLQMKLKSLMTKSFLCCIRANISNLIKRGSSDEVSPERRK